MIEPTSPAAPRRALATRQDSTTKHLAKLGDLAADSRLQLIAIGLFAMALTCLYHPLTRAVTGDNAIYVYIAQTIARGGVPYRDVVDIKGPGSVYISAIAMIAGRLFGISQIVADRVAQILMTGALCSVTFLMARDYLKTRLGALITVLFPLMVPKFMIWMAEGGQPKLSMLLCGMLAMLMISRDRPFWAGWWSMCSCLCWQPGLLFGGTAFLIFSKYLTSWKDGRALKALIGGASPLLLTVAYLWRIGALKYFWAYAFEYNYSVFGPDAERTFVAAFAHICKVANRIFGLEAIIVICAIAGWFIYVAARFWARRSLIKFADCPELYLDAVVIPPVVYFAFCLINFQAGPDLLLFFPFFGLFAAYFLLRVEQALLRRKSAGARQAGAGQTRPLLAGAAGVFLITALAVGAYSHKQSYGTLEWQRGQFKPVVDLLGPTDKIFVHGDAEILVLLDRQSINSLVFVDWGMDSFVANKWYGGSFQRIIDDMEAQAPKVVLLDRLGHVEHGAELERWADQHYDLIPSSGYKIYVRKPD